MATVDVLGEEVSERAKAIAAVEEYLRVFDGHRPPRGSTPTSRSSRPCSGLKIDEGFCRDNVERIVDGGPASTATSSASTWRTTPPPTRRCASTASSTRATATSACVLQAYMRRTLRDIDELPREGANVRLCKGIYVEPRTVAWKEAYETAAPVEAQKNGFFEREITPVTLADGTEVSDRRRPARPTPRSRSSRSCSRCSGPTAPSPPATPAR